jgi:hypothetical protein
MESASTRLDWADARGGHEKAQDAYVEMQAMVGVCNSTEGDAQAECDLRLKLAMNMGLGNTLQQLAQGLKPGSGAGLGAASRGKSGTAGGQTQFAVFGPESPRKNPLSKGGGRSDRRTQAAPEQPEAVAASVEELATTKNTELELPGGGGERIMQEYRKLIEEYFKRVAEEK